MKLVIIISVTCAFMVFGIGLARADDVSDLKEQLKALQEQTNTLNAKIQQLEAKQESQANEIKKVPELEKKVSESKFKPESLFEGATVGGHLKLYLLDRSQGERNGVDQHNNLSAGLNHFYLYLSKELEDWLKLDIQTDLSVSASATPSIGSDIGRATSASTTFKIHQAFFTALLPKGAELKAGIFNPMFSEEYAKETWWHELYHQNQGLTYLQSWHDQGVELYKNVDFDDWSLPVYFSVLGGNTTSSDSRFVDNNENKAVLLHIAPEFLQSKLKLLGSFAYGRWDNKDKYDMYHYVGGFDWKYQKVNITGEYIYRLYKNLTTTGSRQADGAQDGYWIRAMYTLNPKWRGLIKYSHAELYQTGIADMRSNNYDTTSLALDYFLTPNSTIIGQYSFIDGKRSDGSEKLKVNRFTLGWRTTF